jgi:hypothetical protein
MVFLMLMLLTCLERLLLRFDVFAIVYEIVFVLLRCAALVESNELEPSPTAFC